LCQVDTFGCSHKKVLTKNNRSFLKLALTLSLNSNIIIAELSKSVIDFAGILLKHR